MKKIGIVTFHFVFNNGAVLQCLALSKFLKKLGNVDVEVLNYQPDYHTNIYNPIINPIPPAYSFAKSFKNRNILYKGYRFIRNICALSKKNLEYRNRKLRKKIFEEYIDKHINSSKRCKTHKDMVDYCNGFDIYIAGSDQIWNSKITNYSIDPIYYLDFVNNDKCIKISYAASANFIENEMEQVKKLIKDFDAISVREQIAYDCLTEYIDKDKLRVDVDPTLLLDDFDYHEFEEFVELPSKYILFYGLPTNDNKLLKQVLGLIKDKYDIPVVDISPIDNKLDINTIKKDVSPGGFLTCIKNADFVVSNSFHGSVFSIIYQKEFWTISPSLHSERLEQLLNNYNLYDRLVRTIENIDYTEIKWDIVKMRYIDNRRDSVEFLKNILVDGDKR